MARFKVPAGRRRRVAAVALGLFLLAATEARSTSLALYADPAGAMQPGELRQAFSGQELQGYYPGDGGEWTESYRVDETLAYRDATSQSAGRWLVNGNRFCTSYDAATFEDGCFLVRRHSANCFDFYALDADHRLTVSVADVRNGANFTARAWRRGEASTCPTAAERPGAGGE